MCEIWEEIKNDGIQEGIELNKISNIKSIMRNLNLDILEAMKALNIPEDEYDKYKELVLK